MSSLMFVATGSLILPAAFQAALPHDHNTTDQILALSRGTAIVLFIIYVLYLFFQLKTHAHLYDAAMDPDEEDPPRIGPWVAGATLVIVTFGIAICSEYLVNSIDAVVQSSGISKTFIGLILLPIVGNAGIFHYFADVAEHVTAVVVAYKDKMDLAIGVAIGSSMQIALFVTPFLVILGWIIGEPMSLSTSLPLLMLDFEIFQVAVIFVAVVITNYLIMDGKSNWMEGVMLLGVYVIVAISYWLYPDVDAQT
jgi:Ca2+:H+ antiporter